jgi:hypothetical protein
MPNPPLVPRSLTRASWATQFSKSSEAVDRCGSWIAAGSQCCRRAQKVILVVTGRWVSSAGKVELALVWS